MNGARPSTLDVIWYGSQPFAGAPLAAWRAIEIWLGIDWAESKDRGDTVWTKGAFAGLLVINRLRLTRGQRWYS